MANAEMNISCQLRSPSHGREKDRVISLIWRADWLNANESGSCVRQTNRDSSSRFLSFSFSAFACGIQYCVQLDVKPNLFFCHYVYRQTNHYLSISMWVEVSVSLAIQKQTVKRKTKVAMQSG